LTAIFFPVCLLPSHDDCLLQDSPLELRVYDHDTFSAHDVIGAVYIDLNPLLNFGNAPTEVDSDAVQQIEGWFPIYDTLRGARGELCVRVSLEFFGNESETRQDTSAGVQFFSSNVVPECYEVERVFGFVEELLVKDDPEHAAFEKIRTARFTNAERQLLLYQLSGELRRQLGRKVLNIGANAVLGFVKELDLEGGDLVARGYGAAVLLKVC
jgi:C2 domain